MPLPHSASRQNYVRSLWIHTVILLALLGVSTLAARASVTATPSSLSFGNVQVGSKETLPLALTNSGSSSVIITRGRLTGMGFSVTGAKLPLTLAAGQSYTFNVVFNPKVSGPYSGATSAYAGSLLLVTVPMSGTGTSAGQLTVSPTTMNLGNVTVGSSGSQTGTISASGSSVTVSSASSSNSQFVMTGLSFPLTLAIGQSASYTVTFTPLSSGTVNGTLTFLSDAGNSPTAESLTGTGVAAEHSVNLSWDASTSQVVGYNVYRGATLNGTYTKINSSLDPTTAYTDNTVLSGQTYYYATTSVASDGEESTYSNLAMAVIP